MLINNNKNKEERKLPDVLECIANLSNDEVFTMPKIANAMLDLLPKDIWENPDIKILDPGCKTGVFLREAGKRLEIGLKDKIKNEEKRREHIYKNMLYGIALTDLTSMMTKRSVYWTKTPSNENSVVRFPDDDGNIFYENIDHTFNKNGKCVYCGASESEYPLGENLDKQGFEKEKHAYNFIHIFHNPKGVESLKNNKKYAILKDMKFDVIIGNPPYQLNSGGYGAQATPIYHHFIEQAKKLNPKYLCMIIPSRWFAGGMGLSDFREGMLNDKKIKVLVDYPNAKECFPNNEIKGGVCYFLRDDTYLGKCEVVRMQDGKEVSRVQRELDKYDTFVRQSEAESILEKVLEKKEETLNKNKINSINLFGFASNFKDYKKEEFKNSVSIYIRGGVGYIKKEQVEIKKELLSKYKVLLAEAAEGKGTYPNYVTGKPIITNKNSCCSFTYIVCGAFDDKESAENYEKYLKTRFVRFLISLKKNTHHLNKEKFSFVPDLDMSKEWTDAKLYKRYNLTPEEIKFIEGQVKEMR